MQEVKFNYQNITAEVSRDSVRIINKNLFVNTDAYNCVVTLQRNGVKVREAVLETHTDPLSEDIYALTFGAAELPGEYTITVSFCLKEKPIWVLLGYEVAFGQYVYEIPIKEKTFCDVLKVVRSKHNIGVRGAHFDAVFSVLNGGLVSYGWGRWEMIKEIPKPNFWRAPVDNDWGGQIPQRYVQWKIASLYVEHHEYRKGMYRGMLEPSVEMLENSVKIMYTYLMPTIPQSECTLSYEVYGAGRVQTALVFDPVKELGDMPEFSVLFKFDADYDHVKWYGLGSEETYADHIKGAKLGIYNNLVKDNGAR